MGWGRCGTDSRGRLIGYYHAATCDHRGCKKRIDRGLAYACGGMHGTVPIGGDDKLDGILECCEGYFCEAHMRSPCFEHEDCADLDAPQLCFACATEAETRYRTDPEWRSLWPTDAPPLASADTHPQGGDVKQAPFMGSAVPEGQTPGPSSTNPGADNGRS